MWFVVPQRLRGCQDFRKPNLSETQPYRQFPAEDFGQLVRWRNQMVTSARNQTAQVLPVPPNPLRVGGRKDRNGCEFGGIFNLVGAETRNESGILPFPQRTPTVCLKGRWRMGRSSEGYSKTPNETGTLTGYSTNHIPVVIPQTDVFGTDSRGALSPPLPPLNTLTCGRRAGSS